MKRNGVTVRESTSEKRSKRSVQVSWALGAGTAVLSEEKKRRGEKETEERNSAVL